MAVSTEGLMEVPWNLSGSTLRSRTLRTNSKECKGIAHEIQVTGSPPRNPLGSLLEISWGSPGNLLGSTLHSRALLELILKNVMIDFMR